MARIPLGVSRFDRMTGGGAPPGSVVLLAGEAGAGAREFLFTSAVMNDLSGRGDDELFDLYYGDLPPESSPPETVHYVSITNEPAAVRDEMRFAMDDDLVDAAEGSVEFVDLSREYFQLTPVPTEWYTEKRTDITGLSSAHDRRDVLDALGDFLTANAAGDLVVIDSLTDLIAAAGDRMDWTDLTVLLKGLKRASYRWGGLVLLLVNVEPLDATEFGRLKEATDGTLRFEWETGGSERARTLVVEQFRGVLSQLEDENIVRFETEINDGGFDISNVRKIR